MRGTDVYVERMTHLLTRAGLPANEYAIRGYLAFVDAMCVHWLRQGRPENQRDNLLHSAAGVLRGTLLDPGPPADISILLPGASRPTSGRPT